MRKRNAQTQGNIKSNNCKLVLSIIRENQDGYISRADIAKMTEMSATSITRITDALSSFGLVKQAEVITNGNVGRNGMSLEPVASAVVTLGISIDSDYIGLCVLNFKNEFIVMSKVGLEQRPYAPEEIVETAYAASLRLIENINLSFENIHVIGVACIGNIDYQTGAVFFAPQFQWRNVELGKLLQEKFRKPVFVENDTKASLIGLASRRKNLQYEDVTYVTFGMGVGSAVMYGGTIIRGSNNAAGEVGHIILEPDGRPCDCGNRGCVQTYLTTKSMIEQCEEIGHPVQTITEFFMAYRAGEEWAVTLVKKISTKMAYLIRNLVYMYNTRYILVGGNTITSFPEVFDLMISKARELMHENLWKDLHLEIITTEDNSRDGAAFVAQERYVEELLKAI